MKSLIVIFCLLLVSCAEYSGATYAGNGDAGGADPRGSRVTSEYKARTFMTDLNAGSFTAKKAIVAGQNQSKVPIAVVRAATTVAGGVIMAGVQKAKDAGDAVVAVSAGKQTTAKTKIAATAAGAQHVQEAAILHPVP